METDDDPGSFGKGHEDAPQGAGRRVGRPGAEEHDPVQRGIPGPDQALRVERGVEPAALQAQGAPPHRDRDHGRARPLGGVPPARARRARIGRSRDRRREGDPPAAGGLLRRPGGEHRISRGVRGDRRSARHRTEEEGAVSAVALFHEDSGGGGEPVLLAHAIGMDHRMWDDLAAQLAPTHRVLRPDARGHGRSPVPPRPYSLEAMAGDALPLLDRLGVEKAHWVGLSMGAMVGIAFALEHPDRLGRLVLANSTSSYGPEGRATWEARAQAVARGGLAAINDMVMSRYFSADFRAAHADVVAQTSRRFLATPVEGYLGCCDAIAELDF